MSSSIPSARSVIPDPVKSWADFAEWYPEYASWQMVLVWLGYALLLFLIALAWKKYKPAAG